MEVAEGIAEVRAAVSTARRLQQQVGFVPTMGALHAGHLSLIEAARRECGFVVVSIFVNPTQFAPHEDLACYPRPKSQDLALCEQAGVNLVFYPAVETMYPPGSSTFVHVEGLSSLWEGVIRPTHFRGVTTVVMKLLQIVQPDIAYFGQKDYQQQVIIRQMVRDLDVPVEIRTCPTVRDADGLALSSRNAYLSDSERMAARCLWQALQQGEAALRAGIHSPPQLAALMQQHIRQTAGVELDYAVVVDPTSLQELQQPQAEMVALVAARIGRTRLLDNAIWRMSE